jgi:hypothetical protein
MDVRHFIRLKPSGQLEFIKRGEFTGWQREDRITFLKTVLKENLSSRVIASAIKLLRELKFRDRYFYRKFVYHIDSSVSNAAKKAMKQEIESDSECVRLLKVLREGNADDRLLIANFFLDQKGKLNENTLISLLSFDDLKLRETIIKKISPDHELDEARLSNTLKGGSGMAWYVRAALVEILGKRKSKHLLDIVDCLIHDSNVEVKLKLINALLNLGEEKAKTYIQKLSHDPIIWVRKRAQRALSSLEC